jgi:two-component system, NarL family, nitrate/nitrite response regulator NarL
MTRTRVLVADNLTIFRSSVSHLLERESDLQFVEASDLDGIKDVVAMRCPDIALVDVDLPPSGGVTAIRWLQAHCSAHTIVWSFEPTRDTVLAAVRAGASGYLRKEISPQGLVRSLRGVMRGEAPLSRDLATLMIDAIHRHEDGDRSRERLAVLSTREREILDYVAQGARNRQIATELTISEFTVKRHVQNILGKLELGSRRAAADFYTHAQEQFASVGGASL